MYSSESQPSIDVQPRRRGSAFFVASILFVLTLFGGIVIGQNIDSNNGNTASDNKTGELDLDLFNTVLDIIQSEHVDAPLDLQNLRYGAIRGLVAGIGDANSNFMDPEETKAFQENLAGVFEGVGIEIAIRDDVLTVVAPLPETPADLAGLKASDQIVAIDDQDTSTLTLDEAVIMIRGEKGTQVKLTITRASEFENKDFEITRDAINIESITSEIREDGIGVISIRRFGEDTADEMERIAGEFLERGVTGIILDVRNNPGGFLEISVDVAGQFIEDGVVVTERFGDGNEQEYFTNGHGRLKDLPVVALVDGGSASASEILAGALQDYDRAELVGVKTFGKGSVQELKSLDEQTSLRLTVARFILPNGREIDKVGIEPDFVVELTPEDIKNGRDPQLDKALEVLRQKI